MGLDITAYKNLSIVENPEINEDGELVNWESNWKPGESMDWSESCFAGRGEGIDSNAVYTWEDSFDFRAGSYSGYNEWRDQLENFTLNYALGDAFSELINFADNEGVIGTVVSKKLLKDFANNEKDAIKYATTLEEEGEWWLSRYQAWEKAFEMASENGAVDFH